MWTQSPYLNQTEEKLDKLIGNDLLQVTKILGLYKYLVRYDSEFKYVKATSC